MRTFPVLAVVTVLAVFPASSALAQHGTPPRPAAEEPKDAPRCEAHGVRKTLCTRCNPKLAPVFKAKGDWCGEHDRPESQCVLCHPALAKKGVK